MSEAFLAEHLALFNKTHRLAHKPAKRLPSTLPASAHTHDTTTLPSSSSSSSARPPAARPPPAPSAPRASGSPVPAASSPLASAGARKKKRRSRANTVARKLVRLQQQRADRTHLNLALIGAVEAPSERQARMRRLQLMSSSKQRRAKKGVHHLKAAALARKVLKKTAQLRRG